jgi:hypothetical protein
MPNLLNSIERLTYRRKKLAFIFDAFSQADSFEFSTLGGNSGVALILEELVKELQEIESSLSAYKNL